MSTALTVKSVNSSDYQSSLASQAFSVAGATKRPVNHVVRQNTDSSARDKSTNQVPSCLKKLVSSIVRSFYSREHSLVVDMLVRNTIMKEDDLCERLKFEKKQLRQYLHTLKTDQFIKSKLQLESDTDMNKAAKITHYFIDYKLFVNVVKYRLDQMQRRLETEQRQSTSRASFRCPSCHTTYTDLEVDRLVNLENPGKLTCVYCRAEVAEEEDNASRTDARALIAKFHQQVRDPIDAMLRECDEIHLSSSVLEPEIKMLEPIPDGSGDPIEPHSKSTRLENSLGDPNSKFSASGITENSVRIVLGGPSQLRETLTKERPVWMSESTVNMAGLGELDRGPGQVQSTGSTETTADGTHTMTPGRIPANFTSTNDASNSGLLDTTADSRDGGTSTGSGDIMQLLLVHERRGGISHATSKASAATRVAPLPKGNHSVPDVNSGPPLENSSTLNGCSSDHFSVRIQGQGVPYNEITPQLLKTMTQEERLHYINVGKTLYGKALFK